MKLHHALAFVLAAGLPHAAFSAGKGPASSTDHSHDVVPVADAGSTSLTCIFQSGSNPNARKREWGLTSSSAWYSLPGNYQTTPYTNLQKFFSTASLNDITAACANSATYYGLVGYTLLAAFAASSTSSNYPIILNGSTELWPQY